MNLIQIQDRLKSLPNDPRVMQMLTAYANGQNPQVPPYLALGELNRRKVLMERAQMEKAGQPPQGTVKDQVEQQAGIMALQQGRQQQAMQRMAQQGGIAGPAPQNIPQPEAQAEPPAMAGGGLASLRPGYRSGGIIAFQSAGSVNDAVEKKEEEEEKYPTNPQEMYELMARKALQEINRKPPVREDYFARQARMIKENPEALGILNKPIGQEALARLEDLQAARRAEFAKQREELAGAKPGILQLLGQAAMGTRGQKGGSALASILGGYSELASGAEAKQLQQEQALRMKELDLQQAKADVLNKVEEAQRAYAAGEMGKAQAYMKEGEEIAAKHGTSMRELLGKQLSTASQQVVSREASTQAELDRQQRREDARLDRISREKAPRDRPFNPIEVQYNLLKTGDKEKDAALLQRLIRENAEGKRPGLDREQINKFENLPDVKSMRGQLNAILQQPNPKPESLARAENIRTMLANRAKEFGIDPTQLNMGGGGSGAGSTGGKGQRTIDFNAIP